MTAQRLLKVLALVSLVATAAALLAWRETGSSPPAWMLQVALGAFVLAMIVALVGEETRPRLMLRFLSALSALAAAIALVSDLSRAQGGFTSMLEHIGQFVPSVLAAIQASITRALGPTAWDPVLTTILGVPTFLLFAVLAAGLGYASRRRHKVGIYVN